MAITFPKTVILRKVLNPRLIMVFTVVVAVGIIGKAAIVFMDVWQNPEQGKKYRIRSIPTQIFYDRDGKENYRHEGFFDKPSIVGKLGQLGVKK